MWCITELDAACVACMEDVLALYERPYLPEEPVVFWMKNPCPCMPMCAPRPSRPGHGAS